MKTAEKTKKVSSTRMTSVKALKTAKNPLVASIERDQSIGLTENGAKTFTTTLNGILDLFAMGGALRTRTEKEVTELFLKAKVEDTLLAMKCLFNIRNIRGGAGERKTFRIILKYMGENYPDLVRKNIGNIVHYGRFDDLFSLVDTKCENDAFAFMAAQLDEDFHKMKNKERISLACKWTPSNNTSSSETKKLAEKFRKFLGITPKVYRKSLAEMRSYSNVLETLLSANKWENIDYSKIPSKAGLVYRDAFKKHDPTGYNNFLEAVKKGEKKINTSALFPYEIVEKVLYKNDTSDTINVLWNALPNYLENNDRNILVVNDCSGSMNGRPLAISVSLALYTAERNKGSFNGYFITFSESPKLQKVIGSTISEKIRMLSNADWGMSTNVQSVFDLILTHAIKNNVPQNELPEQIILVSDMQFDVACRGNSKTNFELAKEKFKSAGYELPSVCFWNCSSRQNDVPAQADERGVTLISGASPSSFKTLLSGQNVTPTMQMLETLNNEKYDRVVI